MHLTARPCCLDPLAAVEFLDSTEQLKAWAKMTAATGAISFALGATAALVANRYTGLRDIVAPAFTNKTPAFAPRFQVITSDFYCLFERGGNATAIDPERHLLRRRNLVANRGKADIVRPAQIGR